jgi:hypothetical protein
MNKDRGIIKWAPFSSLPIQNKMIKNLIYEKNKIKKPILSEEQIKEIENIIIEAFYEQANIKIEYFKNGYLQDTIAKINNIDYTFKKIYLNNQKIIFFNQIINAIIQT